MPALVRLWPVKVAAILSIAVGLVCVALAGFSLASGHGAFSWQIASMLTGYGLMQAAAGMLLWHNRGYARGPVVALALLNAFVAGQSLAAQPAMWLLLMISVATAVCAALPGTGGALGRDVSRSDALLPPPER